MTKAPLKTPLKTPRQRVWESIRSNAERFTTEQVAALGAMKYNSTHSYITGLKNAGFIAEIDRVKQEFGTTYIVYYKLIHDVGHTAPRVNRKGEIMEMACVNTAMWNTLRICGAVNARQLASQASTEELTVSEETANTYLKFLYRAGYLACVSPAIKKSKNLYAQAIYRLLPDKNTGKQPPQIQRTKQVFDPNINAVVYQEKPELAEEIKEGLLADKGAHHV